MWVRRGLAGFFSRFQRGGNPFEWRRADLKAVVGRFGRRGVECDDCAVVEADAFAEGCRGGPRGGGLVQEE